MGGNGNERTMLDVLDTAGYLRDDQFIVDADICLLVFSIDSQDSFEQIQTMRTNVLRHIEGRNDLLMIAVGNKCDLRMHPQFNNHKNKVNMENVFEWCKEKKVPYIETSAKKGKNINFLFRQSVCEWQIHHAMDRADHSAEIFYSE